MLWLAYVSSGPRRGRQAGARPLALRPLPAVELFLAGRVPTARRGAQVPLRNAGGAGWARGAAKRSSLCACVRCSAVRWVPVCAVFLSSWGGLSERFNRFVLGGVPSSKKRLKVCLGGGCPARRGHVSKGSGNEPPHGMTVPTWCRFPRPSR